MNRLIFGIPMMRAGTLAFAATMFCAVPVVAQDNNAPPSPPPQQQDNNTPPPQQPDNAGAPPNGHMGRMDGQHRMDRMTKELNLSPDQVSQIKAINEDTQKQAMAVRDDSTIAKADKHSKMMDIHKAAQDKIRAVLNDEQKTKYDAMLAKEHGRKGNRGGGDNAAPPPPPPPPM